eukprot:581705-Karenia_brevis.AAC.1
MQRGQSVKPRPYQYSTRTGNYWTCGFCNEKWNEDARCKKCDHPFTSAKLLEVQFKHDQARADYERKKDEDPSYRSTFMEYLAEYDITFTDTMDDSDVAIK